MASLFRSTTTYDPIFALLNADTRKERDKLTENWRDHKLSELNFIGIVGALLAGCLTSTGSWPNVLQNGKQQPWTVRACWYCGIILALASVLVAAQQSIRLHRLSCHPEANINIRRLMSQKHNCKKTGARLPRKMQVYTWQMSVLFLTLSVVAMLSGMCILIWQSTGGVKWENWWNDESKLAVTFTVILLAVITLFVFEQITLYSWRGEDDTDEECEIVREENETSPLL
ncbi:Hypothetical protein D9617_3g020920 [Elsinoe fawcettii]|nr:Hypothetical protein D9617_3g020920 [Elsinoe fawcettii]